VTEVAFFDRDQLTMLPDNEQLLARAALAGAA
jgi:hypothetical protein